MACLDLRFSPRATRGVLVLYEKHGDVRNSLLSLIKLVAWQFRWYSEVSRCFRPRMFIEVADAVFSFPPTCSSPFGTSSRKRAR